MSEICKNLWAKLDEYKRYIDFLKEENLERTFKDCKTEQEFKDKLEIIKLEINNALVDFNNAKLVDVRDQKVFWKDAVVLKKLSGSRILEIEVNDNHRISSIALIFITEDNYVKQDMIDEISKLEGLEFLQLLGGNLSKIDLSKLNNLQNLKRLGVSRNLTQTQIDEISTLEGLEELYLSGNDLSGIDLSKLKNLKRLVVEDCNLTQTQIEGISNLKGLEELDLSGNYLSEIDLLILKNPKLKHLKFSGLTVTAKMRKRIMEYFESLGCEVRV